MLTSLCLHQSYLVVYHGWNQESQLGDLRQYLIDTLIGHPYIFEFIGLPSFLIMISSLSFKKVFVTLYYALFLHFSSIESNDNLKAMRVSFHSVLYH